MDKLNQLRKNIDVLDDKLIEVFLDRMDVISDIATYKKLNDIPAYDENRERLIF
jgi:chorismate mutase